MAAFLSQEWFAKVDELTAAAGDLNIPSSVAGLVLNVTVNGAPEGSVDLALNGGKFELVGQVKADAAIGPDVCNRF